MEGPFWLTSTVYRDIIVCRHDSTVAITKQRIDKEAAFNEQGV